MDNSANGSLDHLSGDALSELLGAYQHARTVEIDVWQFAVEIQEVHRYGLSNSDMRRLILEDYVEHRRETTSSDDKKRKFKPLKALAFSDASCFVLTTKGYTFVSGSVTPDSSPTPHPSWDWRSRELVIGNALIKRFRCPAQNQEAILSAFQEEQWPPRIDDPLTPVSDHCPKRRLHDAIKGLNRHQKNCLIRFRGDGTGEGIIWEFCEKLPLL